MSYVSKASLGG